jgi:Uma2 family endonuclease
MHRRAHHRYTYREYLQIELGSPIKHEFFDGEIYAMAGGTPEHAALAAEIIAALRLQLADQPCRVYTSDLRVRVLSTGLSTYPDVTVICGQSARDAEDQNAVTNPKLIVEVLSESTESYDRGEKLEHYQQIDSLEACVLISHRERLMELWTRRDDRWVRTESRAGTRLVIGPLHCELDVDAIYDRASE